MQKPVMVRRLFHGMQKVFRPVRLDKKIKGPFSYRIDCRIKFGIGRHKDDGPFGVNGMYLFKEFNTGHFRHLNVSQNNINIVSSFSFCMASMALGLMITVYPYSFRKAETDSLMNGSSSTTRTLDFVSINLGSISITL